jgi:hypothetical protein
LRLIWAFFILKKDCFWFQLNAISVPKPTFMTIDGISGNRYLVVKSRWLTEGYEKAKGKRRILLRFRLSFQKNTSERQECKCRSHVSSLSAPLMSNENSTPKRNLPKLLYASFQKLMIVLTDSIKLLDFIFQSPINIDL